MQAITARRVWALIGSLIFLIVAPGTVGVYIPWTMTHWHIEPPLFGLVWFPILGVVLMSAGLLILFDSFVRFAWQGLGTPAPIAPTKHLVVTGFYRYVRNPMYVAVVSLILGQGLLLGSIRVLRYGIAIWLAFFAFVLLYEEPSLRRTFTSEYENYCAHVPRWIPRMTPWSKAKQKGRSAD